MSPVEAAEVLGINLPADREAVRRAFLMVTRHNWDPDVVKRAIDARRILDALTRPS